VANGCWGELGGMSSSWSLELRSPELSYGWCGEGEQVGSADDDPRDDGCPGSRWSLRDPSFSGIMTM
jgi:hypothetical protein